MQQFQEPCQEFAIGGILALFEIALFHLLPLLGLHHWQVVVLLDAGDVIHDGHAPGQQFAQLCIDMLQQGTLFDEVGVGCVDFEDEILDDEMEIEEEDELTEEELDKKLRELNL